MMITEGSVVGLIESRPDELTELRELPSIIAAPGTIPGPGDLGGNKVLFSLTLKERIRINPNSRPLLIHETSGYCMFYCLNNSLIRIYWCECDIYVTMLTEVIS
jgi:hypothetical protein